MSNSTKPAKPPKPYPDFPLFAHNTKRWAKKIRGKLHYFGRWDDTDAALLKYLDQKDDLHAGRKPRTTGDGLAVADLCNHFLNAKRALLESGELAESTFSDYFRACDQIVGAFGRNRLVEDLAVDDFGPFRASLSVGKGPVFLGVEIGKIRMVFKFAYDQGLIDRPVRFGQSFDKPSKKMMRVARSKNGLRMFEADELRMIIEASPQPMKAMVLLAINCGFGQSDLARIPQTAFELEQGWVNYPRAKTGVPRREPLWVETIEATQEALVMRPEPKDEADRGLCFLTVFGNRWVRMNHHENPGKRTSQDSTARQFGDILRKLGINGRRSFYALRHTFQTIGGESKDPDAVSSLMGHVDNSTAGMYRERISDERLQDVVEVVRRWLWPNSAEPPESE